MKSWITNNWQVIVSIGLLATVAGLSLGNCPSACTSPVPPATSSQPNIRKSGEEAMFTLTRKKSNVEHANEANFDQLVLDSNVPVLVDFYADWCGPCKMIAPVLEELASETADAKIVKINVDENPQLAARYGISSIPSLLVFKDGDVADQHVGLANKAQLRSMIEI
jgi:thioredoxin 1